MSSLFIARKEAILSKLLSNPTQPIPVLAKQEGVSKSALYEWRKQLIEQGRLLPPSAPVSKPWSAANKFAIVIETAAMNQNQLTEYCRNKGLYPEQVKTWYDAAVAAQDDSQTVKTEKNQPFSHYKKQIKRLEREVQRKDKALAEVLIL